MFLHFCVEFDVILRIKKNLLCVVADESSVSFGSFSKKAAVFLFRNGVMRNGADRQSDPHYLCANFKL